MPPNTPDNWRSVADDSPPESRAVIVQYSLNPDSASVAFRRHVDPKRTARFRPWYDVLRREAVNPPILWQPLPAPRRLSE